MTTTNQLGSYGDTSGGSLSFRNKLINGGFDIWQRGTSQTSTGYGSDDRWQNQNLGSTKTHTQQAFSAGQTDVPGNPKYWSRTVVASVAGASNYCIKQQPIENVATLAGQTATISFWAKADAAKNIAFELVQYFGTGGSPSASVTGIGTTTCALTTAWKKFVVTVQVPSISGKTLGTNNDHVLGVYFWLDAGSSFNARTNSLGQQSGTFDIANVQLEAGDTATPFEQRPIGTELVLCQRYCFVQGGEQTNSCVGYGFAKNTTVCQIAVYLPVKMRVAPTLTSSGAFQLSDGVAALAVSSFSAFAGIQSSTLAQIESTSSSLTAFKPYRLETVNSGALLILSAEI